MSNKAGDSDQTDKLSTMKERAKKARHEAYAAAKERQKKDPRTLERKEQAKQARRAAYAAEKERRKTDPKQIALRERQKEERKAATKAAREQRQATASAAKAAERAEKDSAFRKVVGAASAMSTKEKKPRGE